jgi:HK97 family phage major capsid protein
MEYADMGLSDAECRAIRAGSTMRDGAERRGLTEAEFRAAVEAAENAPETGRGSSVRSREESERIKANYRTPAETPTDRDAVLQPEHRFSDWMKANHAELYANQTKEARVGSWPSQWDRESTVKYWRGMCTGDWRNAEAEHRAAMAEGAVGTGGYLVPSPVAAEYVDLLRDNIVVMQGMSHTVPWNGPGSTMALPVTVTDVQVQNLAEGVDMYPPASDITVNRYPMVARPYAAVESWSWELEEDSAVPVPDLVMRSFAQRMARAVQTDFFYGTGATFIQGISTAAGLLSGFEGGASPPALPTAAAGKAWTYVDAAITATRTAKSDTDMIVTSPLCFSKYNQLQNTLFDALDPTPTVQSYIDGRGGRTGNGSFYLTTAIKDNITVGADVTDVSDMYFLNSDFVWFGIKHSMSVLPLRERLATQRSNGAVCWLRLDAVLAHAEACYKLQVKTS